MGQKIKDINGLKSLIILDRKPFVECFIMNDNAIQHRFSQQENVFKPEVKTTSSAVRTMTRVL